MNEIISSLYQKLNIIVISFIFILLQYCMLYYGVVLLFFHIFSTAAIAYPILLIFLIQKNTREKITKRNFLIYCLIIVVHVAFYIYSIKLRPFENYLFYIYMSLIQGSVSFIIFLCINWMFRRFIFSNIIYSFLAGIFALTPAFFLEINILGKSPDYFLPSWYNYIILMMKYHKYEQ